MGNDNKEDSLSAVDVSVQTILTRIASGRFVAGQRLQESDLAEQLGVSKNVLREAFARLKQDGVLDVQRFKGAMVRRLSFEDVLKILSVNTLLFAGAMKEAAISVNKNKNNMKILKDIRQDLIDLNPRDQRDHLEGFYNIHDRILLLTENQYLSSLLNRGVSSLLKEFIIDSIPFVDEVVEHTRRLDDVLEFVERGDGEAAFEALRVWAKIERAWVNPIALNVAVGPDHAAANRGKKRSIRH
ncbi:GntR family transcriptional regulator [Croceicoccus bisphenolivorans]|uniref:GntR family transcriptional regulator n=1 Tax=Croceicoccus bisphenolivorans TaxID=1783232 RepID=UPI0009EE0E0D|nr:GntR family transcriptional regulator [Croceicoccus bisphenolivorans]